MGFEPSDVIDAISSVVDGELGEGVGGVWGDRDDMEVLGGGNGVAVLIEWAELHEVYLMGEGVSITKGEKEKKNGKGSIKPVTGFNPNHTLILKTIQCG